MERPICLASNAPPRNPTRPLISANSVASAKNNAETGKSPAPSAFINPISLLRSQAGRIAAGEGIFRLGQSTDVNTAHRARPPDDLLGQRKWRDDLVIFRSAGRKNAGNCMALTGDFNLISRMACDPCRQPLTEENALRTVIRPLTLDFPPGVRRLDSGHEVLFSELNMLGKISSEQGRVRASKVYANRQHRSEPHDVIAPEHTFDLRQMGFVEIGSITGWLQIHAADFHVQSIFLRRDDQVGTNRAQFAIDLVANIRGHRDHRGRNAHTKGDRNACQKLAPFLPPE